MALQALMWTFAWLLAVGRIDLAKSDHDVRSPQKILLKELLDRYGETSIRPVINQSAPVVMGLSVYLRRMVSFNQSKQELKVIIDFTMTWRDEYLKWDPAEYNDVDFLFVSVDKIWTFDLTLYSSVGASVVDMDHDVLVKPDGMVTWFSSAVLQSSCYVRPRYFPFDKQYCRLVLASWAYDNSLVTINVSSTVRTLRDYVTSNGVWDLYSSEEVHHLQKWACCTQPFPEVRYLLIFKRQSAYYIITLIVPGTALCMVSILVFFMPPNSEEKVALASSNLLAMLVFQELMSTSMPPIGNQFPLIGSFFNASIVISTFSIFASICIMYLHKKDNQPVPTWLRKLTMLKTGFQQSRPVQSRPTWVKRRLSGFICTISQAVYLQHRQDTSLGERAVGPDCRKPSANEIIRKNDCHLETKDEMVAQWQEVASKVNRMIAVLFTGSVMLTALVITFLYIVQDEEQFLQRVSVN